MLSQYYGEDGELTNLEIRAVTTMYLTEKGIKSLEGINAFTELKELYCERNQLTELELPGCTKLVSLLASRNKLTSLNVSGATSLMYIYCSQNRLRGEGMDALVASLPNVKEGQFNVYEEEAGDWNAISYDQVDAAREKGWTVQSLFEGEWLEYDGEDPEHLAGVRSDEIDGSWYNLAGHRFNSRPSQKGIYIQNGRRVVIK